MPNGTMASPNNPHISPDYAPYQSPLQVTIPVREGTQFSFGTIAGGREQRSLVVRSLSARR